MVNPYLLCLHQRLPPANRSKVHLFSTFFFSTLCRHVPIQQLCELPGARLMHGIDYNAVQRRVTSSTGSGRAPYCRRGDWTCLF